jgi:hypothetical protein
MAYTLTSILPETVVGKIVERTTELETKRRLNNGWKLVHDEMMWREGHVYSCTHHMCDVDECGCYRRYPGFLLRRVDSGIWLPGEGETRILNPALPIEIDQNMMNDPAIWIDFETNEMGILNDLNPIAEF